MTLIDGDSKNWTGDDQLRGQLPSLECAGFEMQMTFPLRPASKAVVSTVEAHADPHLERGGGGGYNVLARTTRLSQSLGIFRSMF